MSARSTFLGVSLTLATLSFGCAQVAFNPSFPDNRADTLGKLSRAVKARQGRPVNSLGKPMAFLVTQGASSGKPVQIVAYDLKQRAVVWKVAAEVGSRVVVGKDYIYHQGAKGQLVGRKIGDGSLAWKVPLGQPGERLLGMAADGDSLFYTTETVKRRGGRPAGRLVAVKASSGGTRWERESSGRLGAPAARDGMVFVPLRAQSVAVIGAEDGREKARVRSSDEALNWVRSGRDGVLFGGVSGVYRFDARAAAGTRKGSTFLRANLPESVRPIFWWNGYNAALAGYTAYDRNRLLWQARSKGAGVDFDREMIFVHNYRFLFGFARQDKTGKKMAMRWAYSYPRYDAVASTYTGGSLLLATAHGHVVMLDPAKGLPVADEDLKLKLRGATFDADGFVAPGEGSGDTDLRKTLKEVIWDPDRRFGAVKLFAVEQLGQLSGKDVAGDLVAIVTREGIDPAVYKRAGKMIVSRHDKGAIPLYLRTLKSRYSFVEGSRSKAVDVMAAALGDLKAPEAVQPLLRHLGDHETPLPALIAIVRALVTIGDKSVVEPFRDLLLTYRCDPLFGKKQAQNVLNLVADALLRMGSEDERQLLSFVANDVHSLKALRTYVGELLRKSKMPKKASAKRAAAKPGAKRSKKGASR